MTLNYVENMLCCSIISIFLLFSISPFASTNHHDKVLPMFVNNDIRKEMYKGADANVDAQFKKLYIYHMENVSILFADIKVSHDTQYSEETAFGYICILHLAIRVTFHII